MASSQNVGFTLECPVADHKTLKLGIKSNVEMSEGNESVRGTLRIIRL